MYMKYKIGQPCAIGRDCYNYNCVNGMCTRKKRKYKKKIGDSCDKDNSCYSDVCMDGICVRKLRNAQSIRLVILMMIVITKTV